MPTGSCKTAALRESLKLVMARAARGGLAMTELLSDVDAWTGFADRFTSRICAPAARRQTSQRWWPPLVAAVLADLAAAGAAIRRVVAVPIAAWPAWSTRHTASAHWMLVVRGDDGGPRDDVVVVAEVPLCDFRSGMLARPLAVSPLAGRPVSFRIRIG
ncbi:MAG: hypothetical protein J2P48_06065 [Alphaproteobacteria bacterium]|nr:hypothetical protein [Alphaproteobacteria bacterium]